MLLTQRVFPSSYFKLELRRFWSFANFVKHFPLPVPFKMATQQPTTSGDSQEQPEDKSGSGEVEATNRTESVNTRVQKYSKRKYAIVIGFRGSGYLGMQIQGEMPTIERQLFDALSTAGLISPEHTRQPQAFAFERGSRTDKGVSAARLICSARLFLRDEDDLGDALQRVNSCLPSEIRAFEMVKTTRSFNAKRFCGARTYGYYMPTYALADVDQKTDREFRLSKNRLAEVNDILRIFVGTHNFFNFTSNRDANEMSCNRYIMECSCSEPYLTDCGLEFVKVTLKGQSFVLHQIRKMIGITLAIIRGFASKSYIQRAFEKQRIDVPKAPGLGLVLEQLHFDWYNKKYASTHAPLDFTSAKGADEFLAAEILPTIYETEVKENVMLEWLGTLPHHDFEGTGAEHRSANRRSPLGQAAELIAKKRKLDTETENTISDPEQTEPEKKPCLDK